ncbi:MAG: dehydrogenase [Planctomycetaceae bacterium]|nr:dehydrogenase [Planctomycetaceae bacterium]
MTTRRTFVSFLSALGTYAAFPDCQAAATAPKIKVGQIGTKHAHASGKVGTARKFPELYDVVGIVEPDDTQWNRVKNTVPYKGLPRMTREQLLNVEGLQFICVETEVKNLINTAQACVSAGKHIHLDKPAGINYSGFEKVVQTAKKNNVLIQMGYMFRYNPGFQFIFRSIREGLLGDIFEVDGVISKKVGDSTRKQLAEYAGGTMFELGCHLIDSLHVAMGTPERVSAFPRTTYPGKDSLVDNMLAVFDYPQATATIRSAMMEVDGFRRRQFIVVGSEGTIILRPLEKPILELTLESARDGHAKGSHFVTLPPLGGRYDGDFLEMAAVLNEEREFPFSYQHDLDVQKSVLLGSGLQLT